MSLPTPRRSCSSSKRSPLLSKRKPLRCSTTGAVRPRITGKTDGAGATLARVRLAFRSAGPRAGDRGAAARERHLGRCAAIEARRRAVDAARPDASAVACRRETRAVFLFGLPAQHVDKDSRRQQGARRNRLQRHGGLGAARDDDSDANGRRGRELDRPAPLHEAQARVPEPGRRHLLPLGAGRDPRRGRERREHHVQDSLQRRRRDDGRPARRRADLGRGDRAPGFARGREDHRSGQRRPVAPRWNGVAGRVENRAPGSARRRAARIARNSRLQRVALRADLRGGEAPPAQARRVGGPDAATLHLRRRVRRLWRLLGAIVVRERRAEGNPTRAQAQDQPEQLQQGLLVREGLLPEFRERDRREAEEGGCRRVARRAVREPARSRRPRRSTSRDSA